MLGYCCSRVYENPLICVIFGYCLVIFAVVMDGDLLCAKVAPVVLATIHVWIYGLRGR